MGSLAGKVVLFGGISWMLGQSFPLGDTWEWDGNAWTQRLVAGPPPRFGAAMANLGNKVVLYGGQPSFGVGGLDGGADLYNDTWEWDGTNWTQRMVAGPSIPFISPSMTSLGNKIILVGDIDNTLPPEMCEWDGNSWTQLHPVTPLPTVLMYTTFPIIASSGTGAVAIAFLARYAPTPTYTWDGMNWTQRMVASPISRVSASMATLAGNAVLFGGGETGGGPMLSDTWLWDGNSWTQRNVTGPSARWEAAMAAY